MERITRSREETFAFGKELGFAARPGEIYCLDGELGAGKTVFAQGFAEGLGIAEPVTSPTFILLSVYEEGRLPLYHFDVYRIADESEMEEIGCEEFFYGEGVCLIEWACLIPGLLPENAIRIRIEKDPALGFDYRRITMKGGSFSAAGCPTRLMDTSSGRYGSLSEGCWENEDSGN